MTPRSKKYDVVIVGGGPAGSTAAALLSGNGFETLLIDKSSFPRRKLCGGLLTNKTLDLLAHLLSETPQSLTARDFIEYRTNIYELYAGECLLTVDSSELPFYLVDRARYDSFLLNNARLSGATIVEGERITGVDQGTSEVIGSSGKRYPGRIIIGSDGVNSVVRRALPAGRRDEMRRVRYLATALQLSLERSDCNGPLRDLTSLRIYLDTGVFGYSWVFPNRERIVVGSGGLMGTTRDLRESFMSYLGMLGLATPVPAKIFGHLIPCGGFMREPAFRNVLLIGDAAGFVDPLTGEGIYYAHKSAQLAFESIRDAFGKGGDPEDAYTKLVNGRVLPELLWARRMRRIAYSLIGPLKLRPAKPLAKRIERMLLEVINGQRSYRFLRKIKA
jgi:geranylgeranyl reductase family protein